MGRHGSLRYHVRSRVASTRAQLDRAIMARRDRAKTDCKSRAPRRAKSGEFSSRGYSYLTAAIPRQIDSDELIQKAQNLT